MSERKVAGEMTRAEGLAHARRWREENRAYFDSLYPPAEALQSEHECDVDALMHRDMALASLVVGSVVLCLAIALIGLGWALRGWIG